MGRKKLINGEWVDVERNGSSVDGPVDIAKGAVRRPGAGGRQRKDFFAEENAEKPITRAEYINVRANEEFSRREQSWWRMAWRWLTHRPRVKDVVGQMADAHGRSMADLERRLALQLEQEERDEQARNLKRDSGPTPVKPDA